MARVLERQIAYKSAMDPTVDLQNARRRRLTSWAAIGLSVALLLLAVASFRRTPRAATPKDEFADFVPGEAIVVCGERFDIGTPVILWSDSIGYDAYSERRRFSEGVLPGEAGKPPTKDATPRRYGKRTTRGLPERVAADLAKRDFAPADLRRKVRQFVIHYDAVGSSRRCFRALHDVRGLSVHFMLDLDGTIYQTLDARERAFHAAEANDDSVGVEIASIGARSTPLQLEEWYGEDADGRMLVNMPAAYDLGRLFRRDHVPRPARQELLDGEIQGRKFVQYDFTDAQYDALARLACGLHVALPRIALDAPRDKQGRVTRSRLADKERAAFAGLLGHYHVSAQKFDPGPAFDWERVLVAARRLLAARDAEPADESVRLDDASRR